MDLLSVALVGGATAVIIWFAERFASKRRKQHRGREPMPRQHWYKAEEWFSEAKSYRRPPPR